MEVLTYSVVATPFGEALVVAGAVGVCAVVFGATRAAALADVAVRFPGAALCEGVGDAHRAAVCALHGEAVEVLLDLRGTEFQLQVWRELQKIPAAATSTYGAIAQAIGRPHAYRAVGTAVGQNPVAFLVPCHRVLPASGGIGNYRWGSARKAQMLAWEQTRRAA